MSQRLTRRRRCLVLFAPFALLVFISVYLLAFSADYSSLISVDVSLFQSTDTICTIKPPDPWDPTILQYFYVPEKLDCPGAQVQPELSYLDERGILWINETAISELSVKVECSYRGYAKKLNDDTVPEYFEWKAIKKSANITSEFIEVICKRSTFPYTQVYSNNHNQIIPVPNISKEDEKPSVIMIVLDSISHSAFLRSMNKTHQVLLQDYQTTIMDGLTKIGDNSFINAIAFLAGLKCYEEYGDISHTFDDHYLIWKDFQQLGFATFYAEDYPFFNLFSYLAEGFMKKPVHHYFRPFWLNVDGSYVSRKSESLCYGNTPEHVLQLNYLSQFLKKYEGLSKFALAWFTKLGHEYMNEVHHGDDDLARFLTEHEKLLENSYVMVLADHGHRFDKIRRTRVGRLEERLPFFSIALPRKARVGAFKKNLDINSKKLTTFWDVHATLRQIAISSGFNYNSNYTRGQSLFEPVTERNCRTAEIPQEFCVCQAEFLIDVNDGNVKTAAAHLVHHINGMFARFSQCATLNLEKIHSASRVASQNGRQLRITVELSPSHGIFESLIELTTPTNVTIIGDVNRINRYGNQSICVNDALLHKFCFCSSFIESS